MHLRDVRRLYAMPYLRTRKRARAHYAFDVFRAYQNSTKLSLPFSLLSMHSPMRGSARPNGGSFLSISSLRVSFVSLRGSPFPDKIFSPRCLPSLRRASVSRKISQSKSIVARPRELMPFISRRGETLMRASSLAIIYSRTPHPGVNLYPGNPAK